MSTSTKELIAVYYDSLVFQHLSANTKRDYKYCIEAVWHTMVDNKVYPHLPIKHLDTPKAQGITTPLLKGVSLLLIIVKLLCLSYLTLEFKMAM